MDNPRLNRSTEIAVSLSVDEWDNIVKLISQAVHPERTRLMPPEIDRLKEYQRKIVAQVGLED